MDRENVYIINSKMDTIDNFFNSFKSIILEVCQKPGITNFLIQYNDLLFIKYHTKDQKKYFEKRLQFLCYSNTTLNYRLKFLLNRFSIDMIVLNEKPKKYLDPSRNLYDLHLENLVINNNNDSNCLNYYKNNDYELFLNKNQVINLTNKRS